MRITTRIMFVLALAALLSACGGGFPTGKFVRSEAGVNTHLMFINGGRWEGYYDGNLVTFGQYHAGSERITFESDFQCEQSGAATQAVYAWSFEQDTLTFTPVAPDGCAERAALLSAPFQRAE